jgi:hypothetical protein
MPYSLRWNNPRYWRRRSEEAHTIADSMSNRGARAGMLRLEADYETMAQCAARCLDIANHSSKGIDAQCQQAFAPIANRPPWLLDQKRVDSRCGTRSSVISFVPR